jgi:retron-type reverse transcriptase
MAKKYKLIGSLVMKMKANQSKQSMKRFKNIYQQIISPENLILAEAKARRGKAKQYGVKVFDKNPQENLVELHKMLLEKNYQTSEYTTFKIFEPKERLVFRLPYFPDRITHHAVMNVLEPIFTKLFTADTYSCIKGRGIHGAANNLKKALKDQENTKYCMKLDIVKFYPNVDHEVLKQLFRKKFKDQDLLWLLDEIIDSADGLPIGNYLSQYFANYYLTYFDHWIKENKEVKYYFRYADDIIILSNNKPHLHELLAEIKSYLNDNLKLQVKGNYQVFPVEARGIDFVGYKFYHTHTLLRKSIKKRFAKAISKTKNKATIAAYFGWAKHCNSKHLLKKLIPNERI